MCSSLLYAGAVLLFFLLLVNLTLSRPDGGVFSSIGILILSLFKLVFFIIGLAIGIAICLTVFLGIFVAAAYLRDGQLGRETARKTWAAVQYQVHTALACIAPGKFGNLAPAAACCGEAAFSGTCACTAVDADTATPRAEAQRANSSVFAAQEQVMESLRLIEQRVGDIETSVRMVESGEVAHGEQLDAMRGAMQELEGRSQAELASKFAPVQEQFEQMVKQGELVSSVSEKLDAILLRLAALEKQTAQFNELPQQVTELRGELQQQIEALQNRPEPTAKGRSRKKSV